jgi:hypothetical protein
MTRKIIAGVAGCVLLAEIALFAAEKAQEKKTAAKPKQQALNQNGSGQATTVEKQSKQKDLLDQLIVAYKADDKKAMGEIIKKMETRRDKMQKLAKLNKWHKWAHRQMAAQAGPGWGRGQQMAGPRWGPGWQQMSRGGPACQRPCCWQGAMAGWEPQAGGRGQMPGWGQGPRRFAPQTSNMPRGGERQTKVPPADWGW